MTIIYRKTAIVEIDDSEITDIETGGKNKIEYAEIEYKGYVFILKGDLKIDEGQTSKETTETYTITYNLQGGKNEEDFPSKQIKEGRRILAKEPTKDGYKFKEWNTKSDGSGTKYEVGEIFKEKQDTTLYAIWEASDYTVTFDATGGNAETTSKGVKYNEPYGALPSATKEGHDFVGWYTLESGGEKIEASTPYMVLGDQTLYAHWTLKQYTITYNANGGTGAPAEQKKTHGQALTLSTQVPTKTENEFLGWSKDKNATSAQYAKGANYTEEGNTILYAIWKAVPSTAATKITTANYGESVNYSANGVTDWKVFHKDNTRVYIITSDYLPVAKVPIISGISTTGAYGVYGSINRDYLVNGLKDTTKWSVFVNGITGATATGSPTAELFMESYNKKHNINLNYTDRPTIDNTDTLYVPHSSSYNSCSGYWLASPDETSTKNVWRVYYDGNVNTNGYNIANYGVRPVVSLPTSVKAIKGSDGKWTFSN